tara:strand:- start:290 stop:2020 length:1731 start_codon:yes stop_codon:yes gene_type:complete
MKNFIKIGNFFKNNFFIYIATLSFLIIAHFPVLTGDFLRQDDWNATFWSYGGYFFHPFGHPEFWNATVELFRPIGYLILFISDYICLEIENAKFVRFFTIILISFASYITYTWQVKFLPNNKFFSFCFSVISFCLIASQLHTSTAGYNGMVITLIFGQIAFIYFFKALVEVRDNILKRRYIILSGLLIIMGCMNYAITLMQYFLFLFIFYISNIDKQTYSKKQIYEFIIKSVIFIISIMIIYILMAKFFHFILNVQDKIHASGTIRSIHINWDITNKIYNILNMLKYSFNIFGVWSSQGINSINIFFTGISLTFIFFFLSILIKLNFTYEKNNNIKNHLNIFSNSLLIFFISLILLILSYTPILPIEIKIYDDNPFKTVMPNRYFAVTMPFILYIIMWTINTLFNFYFSNLHTTNLLSSYKHICKNLIFFCTLIFSIYKCNYTLENFVVRPHLTEINYIKKHIEKDILKIIESGGKPTIIILRNPDIMKVKPGNDFDLTINYSHNWLISATIYTLRQFNINTILSYKVLKWRTDHGIHITSDWGELASVNDINSLNLQTKKNAVIIDMNKLSITSK